MKTMKLLAVSTVLAALAGLAACSSAEKKQDVAVTTQSAPVAAPAPMANQPVDLGASSAGRGL